MLTLQYQIHLLLQSKYKTISILVISFLLSLILNKYSIVYCMQEPLNIFDREIARLIDDHKRLTDNLNIMVEQNKKLYESFRTAQTEKQQLFVQYKEDINMLSMRHDLVLNDKQILQKQLAEAKQTIETLTSENLELKLNNTKQKHIIDSLQQAQIKSDEDEFQEILDDLVRTSPTAKRSRK